MDSWELAHRYRRLVQSNKALPVLCPDDDSPLALTIGKEQEPAYTCYTCNTQYNIGKHVFDQMRKVVSEND